MPYYVCRVYGCCRTVPGDGVSCPEHATWTICPACWTTPVLRRKYCRACAGREWMTPRQVVAWLRQYSQAEDWELLRLLAAAADGEPLPDFEDPEFRAPGPRQGARGGGELSPHWPPGDCASWSTSGDDSDDGGES